VHELYQEAVVQIRQVFYPKTATFLAATHLVPGEKAFGAMAFVLTRPQKGSPLSIKNLNNSFWKEERRHVVDWQAPKNGINKNQPAPSAKEMRLPTSQVFVDRGDQWLEVSNPKFVWGDGEAKVC